MSEPRYPDYASDQAGYRAAIARWPEAFAQCLTAEQQAEWKPWFGSSLDGNPVFSARHREKPRGFSIHIDARPENPMYLETMRRTFDERGRGEGPIEHLMIMCADSEEIVPRVREVIREFVMEGR